MLDFISIAKHFRLIVPAWAVICIAQPVLAESIYVYKKDGVTYFTTKAPPAGTEVKVFSSKSRPRVSGTGWSARQRSRLFIAEYGDIIAAASERYQVSEALIRAIIHTESAFRATAISPKGAQGLMQLMPEVARERGVKKWADPHQNISGGVQHFAGLLRRYNGNKRLALAAYNAGPGAVDQYRGIPPYRETQMYVKRVLDLEVQYRSHVVSRGKQ